MDKLESVRGRLLRSDSTPAAWREAATATGGLPVWRDAGDFLALRPDGHLVLWNMVTERVSPVPDLFTKQLAWALARAQYPGLREDCTDEQ